MSPLVGRPGTGAGPDPGGPGEHSQWTLRKVIQTMLEHLEISEEVAAALADEFKSSQKASKTEVGKDVGETGTANMCLPFRLFARGGPF
jgi:hypothetical protein